MRPNVSQLPLLTREEAAERLNVSVSTLRRLGRSGAVDEIRISARLIRIDPASVDSYLSRSRVPGAASVHAEAA